MAEEGGRKGRWGSPHGVSADADELARLMRSWVDEAGLSVRDLVARLQPEHFRDGHVPGRTTVSQRLAGVNPQWDFIEAVADVCSRDRAGFNRKQEAALPAWQRYCAAPRRTGGPSASPASGSGDDEESAPDAYRHAVSRAAAAERDRDAWHEMTMALLTRFGSLEDDLAVLREGASGPRVPRDGARLLGLAREDRKRLAEELAHSEADRKQLTEELDRARAELEALRETFEAFAARAEDVRPVRPDGTDSVPDGHPDQRHVVRPSAPDTYPLATVHTLAEARARGRAEEAERIALAVGRDNTPGYVRQVLALLDTDGRFADFASVLSAVVRHRPARRVPGVLEALASGHRDVDATKLRTAIARLGPPRRVLEVLAALREAVQYTDAFQILLAAGHQRPVPDVPPLVAALREAGRPDDVDWLLSAVAVHRSPTEARALAEALRHAGDGETAERLLAMLSPDGTTPPPEPDAPQPLPAPKDLSTALIRVPVRPPVLGHRSAPEP
ncbi:hypothetical protein I5Q34_05720 [Streptomyces sp. AV19]|uniref:hypothetical protein n=1 Tax=Streptomyces sp. AV19 TaxID=2793068 RepID=UPI0018FE4300|nr:hypothetical protein [Streptomyces sp. AV19]MBH1933799.1 hypothetical protein [Streptomyces sp. AV19]MDG4535696.1 hypothetical protein [Streptomyces sp. AV19]